MSALPGISDINLFRYCQSIIYFDAEIPDRAFDLGMAKQKLDCPEIASASVDQKWPWFVGANEFRKVWGPGQCCQSIQKRGAHIGVLSCWFRDYDDQ